MKYVLDSNVFIQASRTFYAFDIAEPFWTGLVNYAAEGVLCSIDKVRDELKRGNDQLSAWASDEFNAYFASTKDADVINQYGTIVQWAQAQTQYNPPAKKEFMQSDYADTWVIAFAKVNDLTIVTHEIYVADIKKKIPIPNVCEDFDIKYCDLFQLLRELNFKF
ncbi:MAG: DUF4411 family protein [Bacteroidales bacterium]